jgi:hypothetical protein
LIAAPAAAGTNDIGVVVVGEVTMQPQLAAQLELWLRQHGHNVVPAPLPPDSINTLMDCFVIEDETCARKVVENKAKTQSVVFAKVDLKPDADDKTVTLTAYWFSKGRDAIAERRFCERCTDTTLRSTADELMDALTIGTAKDAGKVKITSSPMGKKVMIDGTAIGVTPLEYDLKPGKHEVRVAAEIRDVEIARGETTQVDVAVSSGSSNKLLPIALLGAGGALLVTGIVLFTMDEDVPRPMPNPEKRYRDTAPLGIGLALSGIAVGSIGGYLMFKSKRTSAPVASVTRDGSYIGWAGRF